MTGSHEGHEKQVYVEALRQASQDYEELVDELSILKLLNDSLQAGLGFGEICHKLVRFLTETFNVENASIMILDHEKGELRLVVGKSFFEEEGTVYDEDSWTGKTFKLGEGIAGQVARERRSVLIKDTRTDPRFVAAEGQKVDIRSILCLPLVHGDRLHGVLNLSNSEPGAFTEKKEHALNIIASTASVALSQAIAVDELRESNTQITLRNRELAAVIALSESLHSNLELDSVLAESLGIVSDGFDIDAAAVFLKDERTGTMRIRSCIARSDESAARLLLERINRSRGPEIMRSGNRGPFIGMTQSDAAGQRTCIGVPLMSGEGGLGLLMILCADGEPFEEAELKLLNSFCRQISVAIQNSILISRLRDNIAELKETRNKLIQSDKLALLGEMVSGVAHEINNPLAAIMGYNELLLDADSISEKGRTMLEKSISCVHRCRKIVQGLLSFARKTELEKTPANINDIIDNVLAHREYDLAVSNIEVVRNYEIERPIAVVDPNQIEQVFLNLLNNAFDSMAGRDVPGILEVRSFAVDADTMQVEFIDNGCGIKEEDKAKLFDPFFTTKEVGKGTGLGLSVSYGIIKEHDGDLYLDNAHYCGAKFVITLPTVSGRRTADWRKRRVDASLRPKAHGSILVVDDEEVVIDVIEAALSARGFSVESAANGEEAYEKLASFQYDLIISDIRMPGAMDGPGLYRAIKEKDPEMTERFVFISGDVMEKTTAEFLNESGRAYLLKPFSLSDLSEVIERTLEQTRA